MANKSSKDVKNQRLELSSVLSQGVRYTIFNDGTAVAAKQSNGELEQYVKIAADLRDSNCNSYIVNGIVQHAFAGHEEIYAVEIADGIVAIGGWAFCGCKNLNVIRLPYGISKINSCTFEDCESLESIVIPDGVESVESSAFKGCKALREVILPETLKKIDIDAFKGCSSLESITIPASVESIRNSSFDECPKLKDVKVDPVNSRYSISSNGKLVQNSLGIVIYDPNKKEVIIPKENVDKSALLMDSKPAKTLQKGDYIYFLGSDYTACIAARSVNFKEEKRVILHAAIDDGDGATYAIKEINHMLLFGVKEAREVIVPEGIEVIGDNFIQHSKKLKKVSLPSTLKSLGCNAFFYCENLKEINWNGCAIKRINTGLLSNCNSLKSLTLPDAVEDIMELSINHCKNLQSIILSRSLKRIGKQAFFGNPKLKKIFIPASVEEISIDAFDCCDSLVSIEVDSANSKFKGNGACVVDKATGAFVAGKRR